MRAVKMMGSHLQTVRRARFLLRITQSETEAVAKGDPAMSKELSIKVGLLKKSEVPEADRIMRVAFGTFLGLPNPAEFMGDRHLLIPRTNSANVKALAARDDAGLLLILDGIDDSSKAIRRIGSQWGTAAGCCLQCVISRWCQIEREIESTSESGFVDYRLPRNAGDSHSTFGCQTRKKRIRQPIEISDAPMSTIQGLM